MDYMLYNINSNNYNAGFLINHFVTFDDEKVYWSKQIRSNTRKTDERII